jgi:hypothetical protein
MSARLSALCVLCMLCTARTVLGQTGFPVYGTFQEGSVDSVNLQNLNTVITIPIISTPGRGGTNFSFTLHNNSLQWTPSGGQWQTLPQGGWSTA